MSTIHECKFRLLQHKTMIRECRRSFTSTRRST